MIRVLFWVLLAANIGFFVTMQWGGQLWGEPVVAQPAFNEDKMRLMDATQIAEAERKSSARAAVSAVNMTNMQLALNIATVAKPISPVCLEWGEFSDAELKLVNIALSDLGLDKKPTKRQVEHTIGYWVYIPPLKDKATLTKKIAQLKEDGVAEFFVVQETGAWRNAISLGVFKTPEAAKHYLNALRDKGVRSAQIGKRDSKLKVSILSFNQVDAAVETKLATLQKDFNGSEVKNVSCGLTR